MEETSEHRAGQLFDVDSKWCLPCSCGERFTSPSPSGATAKYNKHAETAAKAARRSAQSSSTTPARAKHCGCGCGQPLAARAGGLFRSGHDARFKSALTVAHAEGRQVQHPLTRELADAMSIAKWLDERRGVGSFWVDKVSAGHKPQPVRTPRPAVADTEADKVARSHARVDAIMQFNQTRRAVPGDMGTVTLKSGKQYGARVMRRENEDALAVKFLEGPSINETVVVADHRFKKAKKHTDVQV